MSDDGGGSGIMGFVLMIVILGAVNLMSWAFDWSFWVY